MARAIATLDEWPGGDGHPLLILGFDNDLDKQGPITSDLYSVVHEEN
jgi:hypothetical protein